MSTIDRDIYRLAIPNIISNITVPLLGMIDIAIAGHLDSAVYIGAIALGSTIFNMIYWNFAFLRMGTTGFTAQAYGARNFREAISIFARSLLVAWILGLLIILFQQFIGNVALKLIQGSELSKTYVRTYFDIAVWSAPAMLSMYAFSGWFIGMQNAKTPMTIAILNNALNIALSFTFVYGLGMKIEGIALGTMLSQWISFIAASGFWLRFYGKLHKHLRRDAVFQIDAFKAFFKVNGNIFLRTFLLVFVTSFFTFASSAMGDTVLAINTLLMQFFMLFSYFMDGFAYAGEALTGKYIGARNHAGLVRLIHRLFFWALVVSLFSALVYAFFLTDIMHILTDKTHLIQATKAYRWWTVLIPIAGFAAFIWDGIYIGATASTQMRNAMIVAVMMFFGVYYLALPLLKNNALWLAFIVYLIFRGIMQTIWAKKALIVRKRRNEDR